MGQLATEVEAHAQTFVEIVELDKLREDAFAVGLGNAGAAVGHIEEDAAIAFTSAADGDVSFVSEFVGVMQQFAQYANEILPVGSDHEVACSRFQAHLYRFGLAYHDIVGHLLAEFVAVYYVVLWRFTRLFQFQRHLPVVDDMVDVLTVENDVAYHDVEVLSFHEAMAVAQHLGKAADNIERGAYLVEHIADECRLLLVGLLCQRLGSGQFLVLLLGRSTCRLQFCHVIDYGLLHGMETVLQSAHFVETRAGSYLPVEMTLGNILRLLGQRHYRRHSLVNDEIAEGQHDQQTEKDDADDGIDHVVVVLENILLRTDEGQSPTGIRQRLLHDKTVGALQIVHRGTFLASSNDGIFGTHENEVGVGISPFAVKNLREHAL